MFLLSTDFFLKINFLKHCQSVKQFGSRSWSGSKLFTKVNISRLELTISLQEGTFYPHAFLNKRAIVALNRSPVDFSHFP